MENSQAETKDKKLKKCNTSFNINIVYIIKDKGGNTMKHYKQIELNEKEYLMVTEESNCIEVVIDALFDTIYSLVKIITKSSKEDK